VDKIAVSCCRKLY